MTTTMAQDLDLSQLNDLLATINGEIQQYLPQLSLQQLLQDFLHGEFSFHLQDLLQGILLFMQQELLVSFSLLGKLMILAVAFSLLKQLGNSFGNGTVQQISNLVMVLVAALLILESSKIILTLGEETITSLSRFMQVLLPLELILLVALGNVTTAGLLQPSLLFAVQAIVGLFRYGLLPLLSMELVLKIVNRFSDHFQLSNLAAFLRKCILTAVGFCSTCFLAVLSIQGISGAALDSVALRAAKYITGAAVPVVGGMVSGLLETIISGSLLIKNGLGILGLIVIFLLTLFPLVKIFIVYLVYHFAAAILQPLGDSKLIGLLEDAAGSFLLVFIVVTITALMFFFMVMILLTTANVAAG